MLIVNELSFTPPSCKQALLQDISFSIEKGRIAALLGASGSGKTTLLRLIAGLEKADKGQITLNGQSIATQAPEKRNIGFLFQDYALFPHLNVQDNVAFGLIHALGYAKKQARQATLPWLERMGLQDKALSKIWALSGGEQQRTALARALITQPQILLLDEPLSALDAHLRQALQKDIEQWVKTSGAYALWVTHDQNEAQQVASTQWQLTQGRLLNSSF